jgi:hypothetical protein
MLPLFLLRKTVFASTRGAGGEGAEGTGVEGIEE